MFAPDDEIICYDGRTLAVTVRPAVRVEARRGRRWWCFGRRGWWVHLSLLPGWRIRKFVLTLAEAGVFLKEESAARQTGGIAISPLPTDELGYAWRESPSGS